MSQLIQVPFRIEFVARRRRWEVCDARLAGYARDFLPKSPSRLTAFLPGQGPSSGVAFHVSRRDKKFSVKNAERQAAYEFTVASDSNLAKGAELDFFQQRFRLGNSLRDDDAAWAPFEIVASFERPSTTEHRGDAWQLRDDFLQLENTSTALANFLSKWGDLEISYMHDLGELSSSFLSAPNRSAMGLVLPERAWQKQQFFRAALTKRPALWLAKHARLPSAARIDGFPHFGMTDYLGELAIETTITLDHLRKVEYRICGRVDCSKPYRVNSAHGRIYCSRRCAHTVNMRGIRAAERRDPSKKGK